MIDPSEHLVVDCDYHFADTFEQAAPYMPEPWRTKFQKSSWGGTGVKQNLSAFFPASTGNRMNYGKIDREFSEYPDGGDSQEDVIEAMEDLDIDASMDLLDRIEDEEAIKGAVLITAGATPPLGNRKYDPIYERLEKLGLPVVFHTGGSGLDDYVRAGYEEMIETHTLDRALRIVRHHLLAWT
ncbi:amidohydrolase family protein [Halobellus ordinarius]|uniref:amidohydrolase family protein n=1 Tax=Halobellus ordinarius TaxID=3075120 RepID=UPI0028802E52|nr:amidohydrolase family protein [Halobellus sp. ZY16]